MCELLMLRTLCLWGVVVSVAGRECTSEDVFMKHLAGGLNYGAATVGKDCELIDTLSPPALELIGSEPDTGWESSCNGEMPASFLVSDVLDHFPSPVLTIHSPFLCTRTLPHTHAHAHRTHLPTHTTHTLHMDHVHRIHGTRHNPEYCVPQRHPLE